MRRVWTYWPWTWSISAVAGDFDMGPFACEIPDPFGGPDNRSIGRKSRRQDRRRSAGLALLTIVFLDRISLPLPDRQDAHQHEGHRRLDSHQHPEGPGQQP